MRFKHSTIIMMILAVAAIGAGAWWFVGYNHPPLGPMVAEALFHRKNTAYYTATATVHTPYKGKAGRSQVTILHSKYIEEIVYPSVQGRVMYSRTVGTTNETYLPKTNTIMLSKTVPLITTEERARLFAANYEARFAGKERVAGRPTYVVNLVPKHDGRASRQVWIDQSHNVILRTRDISHRGQERGGTEFTHIEYTKRPDSSLMRSSVVGARTLDVCRPSTLDEMSKMLGIKITEPIYIPAGYKLEGRHLYSSPCGRCKCAAQLTYTDGLSVISIFQSPTKNSCNMPCCKNTEAKPESCRMSCCELAESGRVTTEDKNIVVVADLAPAEIKKIAQSVK